VGALGAANLSDVIGAVSGAGETTPSFISGVLAFFGLPRLRAVGSVGALVVTSSMGALALADSVGALVVAGSVDALVVAGSMGALVVAGSMDVQVVAGSVGAQIVAGSMGALLTTVSAGALVVAGLVGSLVVAGSVDALVVAGSAGSLVVTGSAGSLGVGGGLGVLSSLGAMGSSDSVEVFWVAGSVGALIVLGTTNSLKAANAESGVAKVENFIFLGLPRLGGVGVAPAAGPLLPSICKTFAFFGLPRFGVVLLSVSETFAFGGLPRLRAAGGLSVGVALSTAEAPPLPILGTFIIGLLYLGALEAPSSRPPRLIFIFFGRPRLRGTVESAISLPEQTFLLLPGTTTSNFLIFCSLSGNFSTSGTRPGQHSPLHGK
jgi:hypothetical protein